MNQANKETNKTEMNNLFIDREDIEKNHLKKDSGGPKYDTGLNMMYHT